MYLSIWGGSRPHAPGGVRHPSRQKTRSKRNSISLFSYTERTGKMARKLRNAAQITIQVVVESPDEVVMLTQAPVCEFPGKKAHQIAGLAHMLQGVLEDDFSEFVKRIQRRSGHWLDERGRKPGGMP